MTYVIILNIVLIFLRFNIGDPTTFQGNMLTTSIFIVILLSLLLTFFQKNYDYFIVIWISFYFASPIIIPSFTAIGSLGLFNAVFIPLMLLVSFDVKNKYFILISILTLFSFINYYDTSIRLFFSSVFQIIAPLIFFYFVYKKCKNTDLIIYSVVFIALINIPLSFYELFAQPSWGIFSDWRGNRILGNLFHPNSYSMYLLPIILLLYAKLKEHSDVKYIILFCLFVFLDILTYSRIGLISLIICIIFFELIYNLNSKKIIFKIIFPTLILVIFIFYNFTTITDNHLKLETINERTGIWNSIIPYAQENLLFGLGTGSYEAYRGEIINNLSPHNVYLSILFELGIIGLLLVLIFLFFIGRDLFNKKESSKISPEKNKRDILMYSCGFSLLLGITIFSLTDGAPFSQVVALNAWILLGCCMSYEANKK